MTKFDDFGLPEPTQYPPMPKAKSMMPDAKPCPFCGRHINPNDNDTLYPAGIGWKEDDGIRSYCDIYDVPKEQWCYKIICNESYGGCGVTMYGDSPEETLEKWNKRS